MCGAQISRVGRDVVDISSMGHHHRCDRCCFGTYGQNGVRTGRVEGAGTLGGGLSASDS